MDSLDLGLRVVGLLVSSIAVTLAAIKQRDIWLAKGRKQAPFFEADAISRMNERMRFLEVLVEQRDLTLHDCERQRDAAHEALAAWDNLVGNIWIGAARESQATADANK
jgi:hypothetical protein